MPPRSSNRCRNSACIGCRKLKIRCDMMGAPPCARCAQRGLLCQTDTTMAKLLRDSNTWQARTERQLQLIREALAHAASKLAMPELLVTDEGSGDTDSADTGPSSLARPQDEAAARSQSLSTSSPSPVHERWVVVMDPDATLAEVPGSCVVPDERESGPVGVSSLHLSDIVAKGIVSAERGEHFASIYQSRLDHFVYRILDDECAFSLDHIREVSPLLSAAICTVGALHDAAPEYEECYAHFASLAATAQIYTKKYSLHDIRACLIGAFWLPELSWSLSGAASRIATELRLHDSIWRPFHEDRIHYIHLRLYHIVYICDHQTSILYGRPPMTQQCEAIHLADRLVDCPFATEDDSRLLYNIEMWSIWTSIYQTFGSNTTKPLNSLMAAHIHRFRAQLAVHEEKWSAPFGVNKYVGHYPNKGQQLHREFAKLFLSSHGLRGLQRSDSDASGRHVPHEINDFADSAVASAKSLLLLVITDSDIQSYLNGLPLYFHVMLAFTAIFLLKITKYYSQVLRINTDGLRGLVLEFVEALQGLASRMHPQHVLVSILKSLHIIASQPSCNEGGQELFPVGPSATTQDWPEACFEYLSAADFDFLASVGDNAPFPESSVQYDHLGSQRG